MDRQTFDLDLHSRNGELYVPLEGGGVLCHACALECKLSEGSPGACRVRINRNGQLLVPWGFVAVAQVEPIEKKPFFHLMPGSSTYGFGLLGCNMHCAYCQNWITSQTHKDVKAVAPVYPMRADELARYAVASGSKVIVSSYNEPLISAEWCVEVFRYARSLGLATAIVSNGATTPQVLEYLRPCTDAMKVDLKSFSDHTYRSLGGNLGHVMRGIRQIHGMGFWLEVVTLLVPGLNDDPDEIRRAADFLVSTSPDIPWHLTAYHKDYQMQDRPNTQASQLVAAAEIGRAAGLRYVYAGNHAGRVGSCEDTRCCNCGEILVRRYGYRTLECYLTRDSKCPRCANVPAGIWANSC